MNIFVLDLDPDSCAKYHCNKHVVKMVLETAQLLCTAHHLFPHQSKYIPQYKPTHKNHPCTKWACESIENFHWLYRLGVALSREYSFRYGRKHKCDQVIKDCVSVLPDLPQTEMTPFAQAMPEKYQNATDSVMAYRSYYFGEKFSFAKWTPRPIPHWFSTMISLA